MINKISWVILPFLIIVIVYLWLLNLHYPFIGTDMEYYSPRLLDTFLHIKNSGFFSIQWWTPSFGGGIPAFPNPIHLQFSITAYLMFFFTPWVSIQITYVLTLGLGYWLIYNYFKNQLNYSLMCSICCAVIFSTNGHFINHTLVGHLNFASIGLIALLPFIVDSSWSIRKCIFSFSIVVCYLIYSGGFPSIFLLYLALLQLVFLIPLLKRKPLNTKRLFKILLISHIIIFLICLAKVVAVAMHMENFPRLKEFSSWQPYYIAFPFACFAQLFSFRFLSPLENFLPIPADSILFWFIGSNYEFWENDVSISPIVLIISIIFLIRNRKIILSYINKHNNIYLVFALIFVFWISFEWSIGKGYSWEAVKDLPVFRSTHVNVRFTGAMILPITLIFGLVYSNILKSLTYKKKLITTIVAIFISILSMFSYSKISDQKGAYSAYNISNENRIWKKIKEEPHSFSIKKIDNLNRKDQIRIFTENCSNLLTHDPIYGYQGEFFKSSLSRGSVVKTDKNNFYNIHNPFIFYKNNSDDKLNSKIHKNDSVNFNLFINRKQPNWGLPRVQRISNWISLISLVIFTSFFVINFLSKIKLKED